MCVRLVRGQIGSVLFLVFGLAVGMLASLFACVLCWAPRDSVVVFERVCLSFAAKSMSPPCDQCLSDPPLRS